MQKNIAIAAFLSLSLLTISILWATNKSSQKATEPMTETKKTPINLVELTAEKASHAISKSPQLLIIDFYAEWCGPCKNLKPIFEEVAGEFKDYLFAEINIDKCQDIAKEYQITSIPTILIFSNGKPIDRITGFVSKETLIKKIKEASEGPKDISKLSQNERDDRLIQALQNNAPLETIKALLDAGANVNISGENGLNPLMTAIIINISRGIDPLPIVNLLLDHGASLEFTDMSTGQKGNILDFATTMSQNLKRMATLYDNVIPVIKNYEEKKAKTSRCSDNSCTI
jgi:thioredoxin